MRPRRRDLPSQYFPLGGGCQTAAAVEKLASVTQALDGHEHRPMREAGSIPVKTSDRVLYAMLPPMHSTVSAHLTVVMLPRP